MKTRTVHILGTGSGVGKSIINAGICRILKQDGCIVAPFKAQNMALNSYVTHEGLEIGRAQAVQALACGIAPTADMNPVLLKPNSDTGSQVILNGKPLGNMEASTYYSYKKKIKTEVIAAYKRLSKEYDYLVMEGAGSPAEVNLKKNDIVNMHMAKVAKCPVVLVGDIDKGGVFAWLIGTLNLLTPSERKMVKGFIINKFRGDVSLLKNGLNFLEKKTGIPVLGVVPYYKDIYIPEEDSVFLSKVITYKEKRKKSIKISVIRLPHISNFTDFDALGQEPDVDLKYIYHLREWRKSDVIIVPGTKNTIGDMNTLNELGFAKKILAAHKKDKPLIIGICGGYQILGEKISDHCSVENKQRRLDGLGLLPICTSFYKDKTLTQVEAKTIDGKYTTCGYEIHHGQTKYVRDIQPMFKIMKKNGKRTTALDGAVSKDKRVWGTYIHGVFDDDHFRNHFLNQIRKQKGLKLLKSETQYNVDVELDKLADHLRAHIDLTKFYDILAKQ